MDVTDVLPGGYTYSGGSMAGGDAHTRRYFPGRLWEYHRNRLARSDPGVLRIHQQLQRMRVDPIGTKDGLQVVDERHGLRLTAFEKPARSTRRRAQ